MKQNKLLYNNLLRMFNKCKRRLSNLIATGRNSNRQTVLQKHIERLYAKIMNLHANIQRGTVIASVVLAAMAFNGNDVQAQTFGPVQNNPFNLTNIGNNSAPTFADLDNDGDLDMLSGERFGNFKYFQNTGTATVPSYSAVATNPFGLLNVGTNMSTPVFVDMDSDGDMDILSGSYNGNFYYFQNTGTASAPAYAAKVTNPFGLTGGYYSCPTFTDLDNDGDMDMLSGNYNGKFYYYQNTGTASAPAFAAVALNPFGLVANGPYSHPTFIDMDNDGDKDIMSGIFSGDFIYYQNTGTATAPAFAAQVLNPFFLTKVTGKSAPVFVDLDNNGDKELMSGVGNGLDNGNFEYFKQVIPGPAAALNFDRTGLADNVILPSAISSTLSTSNKITVEAWVRPTIGLVGTECIIGNHNNPNNEMQFSLKFSSVNFQFYIGNSSIATFSAVNSAASPTLNVWQHVAGVWDGTVASVYVNGMLSGTASITYTAMGATSNSLIIGGNSMNENFNGDIDEVRIWNVARTICQINDYKNCEIPTSASGLLANYHFNQGMSPAINTTVTTLTDASGSAYTGTLTNMGLTGGASNWTAPGGVISNYTVSGSVSVTNSNPTICIGNSTTLTATGADTYTWTGGVTNGATFSPTVTNIYTVTGTSTLTGCTNTVESTVTVNALPTVSVNSGAICIGKSFTISPTGASTYTISGGVSVVSPTTNTSYTVTGTSAQGCVSANTATSSVTVNALPTVSATTSSSLLCTGNMASLTATGATSYTWSTSSTNSVVAISPTVTTIYTVTGADANGCSNTSTVTQNVSTCAGLEMLTSNSSANIYPNPSNGSFTIELASDAKVSISNALGQVVMSTSMIAGTHTIVLNDVNEGIYFVKVISGNVQTIKRLVVSK